MYHQVGGTHGDDIALVRIDCLSAHLSKRFSRASHGNTSAALSLLFLRRRLFYKVTLVQFVWGLGRPLEVILFGQTTQDALLFSLCTGGSLVRFLVVGVFGGVHWKYQHEGEKQHQQRQDDAMDWLGGDHDGKSLLTVLEETK